MARKEITWDGLGKFSVDDDGRLYWDGQAVVLEQRITLKGYELVLATVAATGAALAGIHPFGVSLGWW